MRDFIGQIYFDANLGSNKRTKFSYLGRDAKPRVTDVVPQLALSHFLTFSRNAGKSYNARQKIRAINEKFLFFFFFLYFKLYKCSRLTSEIYALLCFPLIVAPTHETATVTAFRENPVVLRWFLHFVKCIS